MGASASVAIQEQEARKRSRSIDETLAADREKLTKTVKILLLASITHPSLIGPSGCRVLQPPMGH
ncbi:hypothetical protein BaRGS_00030867, partial [Batillaria attramentaria]